MKNTAEYLDLITRELERIEAGRNSLAGFVRFHLLKEPAKHHEIMCQAVMDLLNDEFDDLIFLMPPNSAKSFYTSVAIPPFLLGLQPKAQVLAISGTADLAQSWGRQARNNIANPAIKILFPDLKLSDDSRAVDNFSTTAAGSFRSFGINSQVLGQRASILLIDDPLTSAANSAATLAQLHSYYENEALTRLDPRAGKVILVCQRLDRNDLAGYMQDRNAAEQTRRLKVITLKMVTEEGDEPDGTGRKPGDILWPERFTPMWVKDARRDPFKFATLYQQAPPSDAGQWCQPDWLQYVDTAPADLTIYLLSDLALTIGRGDFSVHLVVGVDHAGRIYVLHAWRDRCSGDDTAEMHLALCEQWQPMESLIEDDNASRMYVITLADRARQRQIRLPWKTMPIAGQQKEIRAAPLRSLFQQKRVFLVRAPWNRWLTTQLLMFPILQGDGADDGVDALGLIGRRLLQLGKPTPPTPPKPPGNPAGSFYDQGLDNLHEEQNRGAGSRRRI